MPRLYIYRHWKICRSYKNEDDTHQPTTVIVNDDVTILCHREIKANRPDIAIKNNKENKYMIIGVAVPSEYDNAVKVEEKLLR